MIDLVIVTSLLATVLAPAAVLACLDKLQLHSSLNFKGAAGNYSSNG